MLTCSCGSTFTTRSTAKGGQLHADVCSACHPFYTGKQKIMDVGGRVDKFEKRFGKRVRPGTESANSHGVRQLLASSSDAFRCSGLLAGAAGVVMYRPGDGLDRPKKQGDMNR